LETSGTRDAGKNWLANDKKGARVAQGYEVHWSTEK